MKKMPLEFNLQVSIFKEGKSFIAFSPVLDLSSSGDSPAQAKSRFDEAMYLFFEELMKKGVLDEAMENLGWTKAKKTWEPPVLVRQQSETIRIPVVA